MGSFFLPNWSPPDDPARPLPAEGRPWPSDDDDDDDIKNGKPSSRRLGWKVRITIVGFSGGRYSRGVTVITLKLSSIITITIIFTITIIILTG